MATVVDRLPEGKHGPGATSKYAPYLDGQVWRINGRDVAPSSLLGAMAGIRAAARTSGLRAVVRLRHEAGEQVAYVQVTKAGGH